MIKEFKEFVNLPENAKLVLLKALDYEVDRQGYVVDSKNKSRVICKYSKKPVLFKDASILPGSTIIINSDPLTISEYIGEYLEPEEELNCG